MHRLNILAIVSICGVCLYWIIFSIEGSTKSSNSSSDDNIVPPLKKASASFTYYQSYPMCCPSSPNYDPAYPTSECADYSGCKYMGDFAGYVSDSNPEGYQSIDFVKSNNMVAFYDDSDPSGTYWFNKYALRTIGLKKEYNGKVYEFNATIADTCGNGDCNNCCATNSKPSGYLVDMEYYTVMNNFGTTNAAEGELSFVIY